MFGWFTPKRAGRNDDTERLLERQLELEKQQRKRAQIDDDRRANSTREQFWQQSNQVSTNQKKTNQERIDKARINKEQENSVQSDSRQSYINDDISQQPSPAVDSLSAVEQLSEVESSSAVEQYLAKKEKVNPNIWLTRSVTSHSATSQSPSDDSRIGGRVIFDKRIEFGQQTYSDIAEAQPRKDKHSWSSLVKCSVLFSIIVNIVALGQLFVPFISITDNIYFNRAIIPFISAIIFSLLLWKNFGFFARLQIAIYSYVINIILSPLTIMAHMFIVDGDVAAFNKNDMDYLNVIKTVFSAGDQVPMYITHILFSFIFLSFFQYMRNKRQVRD